MNGPDRRATLLRQALDQAGRSVPTHDDWGSWLFLAQWERVVPLLYRLVDTTPTDLDDDQRTDARQRLGVAMCRCVQLEHHLLAVTETLRSAGIRSVVLKGGATAHLDYPDPSLREFSDIDLLIDPVDLSGARGAVEAAGWTQGYSLPSGHDRFTHAVTFVRDGMELDLHQRIAHRALGRLLPTEELMAEAVPFRVAGTTLLALDPVDRLIHSTVHAVASGRAQQRLSTLADILIVTERHPDLAPEVLERAERRGVRSLVERGICDAYDVARLPISDDWRRAMARPTKRRDRLVDRAYLDVRRRPVLEELAHLRHLGGVRDPLRYVAGFFVDESRGLPDRLRYVWSKVRNRA